MIRAAFKMNRAAWIELHAQAALMSLQSHSWPALRFASQPWSVRLPAVGAAGLLLVGLSFWIGLSLDGAASALGLAVAGRALLHRR